MSSDCGLTHSQSRLAIQSGNVGKFKWQRVCQALSSLREKPFCLVSLSLAWRLVSSSDGPGNIVLFSLASTDPSWLLIIVVFMSSDLCTMQAWFVFSNKQINVW